MASRADIRRDNLINGAIASVCLFLAVSSTAFAADQAVSAGQTPGVPALYAKVGDREITVEQYNQSFNRAVRQRFYHSKPPEAEIAAVRREVGDELITRELLLLEAERTNLQPDKERIQATLEQYDQRYAGSPRWEQERAGLLGALKIKLEQDDLLRQIESKVRNIAAPGEKQLKDFYEQNLDKFTEPMQMKLSLILLAVDPSAASDVWQAALDTGHELVSQLNDGTDFAELAFTGRCSVRQCSKPSINSSRVRSRRRSAPCRALQYCGSTTGGPSGSVILRMSASARAICG